LLNSQSTSTTTQWGTNSSWMFTLRNIPVSPGYIRAIHHTASLERSILPDEQLRQASSLQSLAPGRTVDSIAPQKSRYMLGVPELHHSASLRRCYENARSDAPSLRCLRSEHASIRECSSAKLLQYDPDLRLGRRSDQELYAQQNLGRPRDDSAHPNHPTYTLCVAKDYATDTADLTVGNPFCLFKWEFLLRQPVTSEMHHCTTSIVGFFVTKLLPDVRARPCPEHQAEPTAACLTIKARLEDTARDRTGPKEIRIIFNGTELATPVISYPNFPHALKGVVFEVLCAYLQGGCPGLELDIPLLVVGLIVKLEAYLDKNYPAREPFSAYFGNLNTGPLLVREALSLCLGHQWSIKSFRSTSPRPIKLWSPI
jgi:hypothetical protein